MHFDTSYRMYAINMPSRIASNDHLNPPPLFAPRVRPITTIALNRWDLSSQNAPNYYFLPQGGYQGFHTCNTSPLTQWLKVAMLEYKTNPMVSTIMNWLHLVDNMQNSCSMLGSLLEHARDLENKTPLSVGRRLATVWFNKYGWSLSYYPNMFQHFFPWLKKVPHKWQLNV